MQSAFDTCAESKIPDDDQKFAITVELGLKARLVKISNQLEICHARRTLGHLLCNSRRNCMDFFQEDEELSSIIEELCSQKEGTVPIIYLICFSWFFFTR